MSRLFVVAAVLGLVACTDRDDVSAPESEPATSPVASALELSESRVPGGAHSRAVRRCHDRLQCDCGCVLAPSAQSLR